MLAESIPAEPELTETVLASSSPPTKYHPCRARGMKQINCFITPEEQKRIKQYCRREGITMAKLIRLAVAKEIAANPQRPTKPMI